MKALLLASLIFSAGSVFAQVKEYGSATCIVKNAGISRKLLFKIASPTVTETSGENVIMKNSDNTYTKIALSVTAIKNSSNYTFSILAQKANTVRDALDGYFIDYNGTTFNTTFPIDGSLTVGVENQAATHNIFYACQFNRY